MDDDALVKVEHRRQELEKQVTSLRKALRHWQTWEIEYEGLREEILSLPESSTSDELFKIAQDFKAELVDDNEIRSLLGQNTGKPRSPRQVVDLLARRVDYVSRNSESILKQLTEAEKKRNALLLAEDPDHQDEAGLPLTEITEELDEDGNVISASTSTPSGNAPQLLEALKKAGVKEVLETDGIVKAVRRPSSNEDVSPAKGESVTKPTSEKIDSDHQTQHSKPIDSQKQNIGSAQIANTKLQALEPGGDERKSLIEPFEAKIPDNESEDDAVLRREMIDYQSGIDEVGAVVAELELEEGDASDFDSYDENMDDISSDETQSDESEDEYGRSKKSPFTDKYIRQMLALERKLGAKGMQNLGPNPDLPEKVKQELDKAAPVRGEPSIEQEAALVHDILFDDTKNPSAKDAPKKKKSSKKKVAFAEDLDIVPPATSDISERSGIATSSSAKLAPPQESGKKLSRFKQQRQGVDSSTTKPISPAHPAVTSVPKTHSESVIERPTASSITTEAPSLDDIDERLHRQEIATEYHALRSRMIQRQGGFVEEREQEQEQVPLPEDMGGKKISRFKAARLR